MKGLPRPLNGLFPEALPRLNHDPESNEENPPGHGAREPWLSTATERRFPRVPGILRWP